MHLVTFQPHGAPGEPGEAAVAPLSAASLGYEELDFCCPGTERLGALVPPGPRSGDVVDLNRALAVKLAAQDVGAPEAEADSLLPSNMLAFLRGGETALAAARDVLRWTLSTLDDFDGPDLVRGGVVLPRRRVALCAPVPCPGKILCVARNYGAHAAEVGQANPPSEPVFFIKATSAVNASGREIVLPAASQQVDYEGELAVVIGQRASRIPTREALVCVAGYTIANDVTARDFQNARGQHFLGKSCDTFAPLGPTLVTADEIADPQKLELHTSVSGELRQSASTGEMIFPVAELIAFVSRLMTLEPGDVLLTGTPSGVGAGSKPPRWLRDGDVVDVEISGIGRLRNHVTHEAEEPN